MPVDPAQDTACVVVAVAEPTDESPRPYPTYVIAMGPARASSHHGEGTPMCRMFDDIPDDPGILFEEMPLEEVLSKEEWEPFTGDPAPIVGRAFRAALVNGWAGGDSYLGGNRAR